MTQPLSGITSEQARRLQARYGKNELTPSKKQSFARKALGILLEPMFVLLLAAAAIYFVLGEPRDGAIMLVFVVGVIAIDVIQEWKTDKTLTALRELAAPRVKVVRDGVETIIESRDLVPGDLMLIREGERIPADGRLERASDLCVDESSLTGEPCGVWKTAEPDETDEHFRRDWCYAGTLVTQGSGAARVTSIGTQTEYGRIGAHVAEAPEAKTPLQRQTGALVKRCAILAAVLFALVSAATYLNLPSVAPQERIVASILSGIALAMAMIPEEFPVILTVFLSMGAWRLAKKHSLVRRLPSVETLGAVSVLCVDKTGTITENRMAVQEVWAADGDEAALSEIMGLACEPDAYDPMERAMLAHCEAAGVPEAHLFEGVLIREYPFTNERKMMGHVWRHDGEIIIAAKGSPERILALCDEQTGAAEAIARMSGQGLRVIAVAMAKPGSETEIPERLEDCRLALCGLIGLADPPRAGVSEDIAALDRAGVRVVMITGDHGETALAIARKIGMRGCDRAVTGDELEAMSEGELCDCVREVCVFSRVLPAHKMRIVRALKANGEIVAMTGDGVNDAPALKYADIGIAMGKRGAQVSREAADLILMDDNFSTIVETIRDGRRIHDNIRKAVGYVFSIHIPIALASLLAPMLKIPPESLMLLPLHVVLLELLIDPTCSIVLERGRAEPDVMDRPPRRSGERLLTARAFARCALQGLALFAGSFGLYVGTLSRGGGAATARAMGLTALMLGNLFLVLVNSSARETAARTLGRLWRDKVMWAVILGTLVLLALILYTPLSALLGLAPLTPAQALLTLGVSAVSTLWVDLIKVFARRKGA